MQAENRRIRNIRQIKLVHRDLNPPLLLDQRISNPHIHIPIQRIHQLKTASLDIPQSRVHVFYGRRIRRCAGAASGAAKHRRWPGTPARGSTTACVVVAVGEPAMHYTVERLVGVDEVLVGCRVVAGAWVGAGTAQYGCKGGSDQCDAACAATAASHPGWGVGWRTCFLAGCLTPGWTTGRPRTGPSLTSCRDAAPDLASDESTNNASQYRENYDRELVAVRLLQFSQRFCFVEFPNSFETLGRVSCGPVPHHIAVADHPGNIGARRHFTRIVGPVSVVAVVATVVAGIVSFGASYVHPFLGVGAHFGVRNLMLNVSDQGECGECGDVGTN